MSDVLYNLTYNTNVFAATSHVRSNFSRVFVPLAPSPRPGWRRDVKLIERRRRGDIPSNRSRAYIYIILYMYKYAYIYAYRISLFGARDIRGGDDDDREAVEVRGLKACKLTLLSSYRHDERPSVRATLYVCCRDA